MKNLRYILMILLALGGHPIQSAAADGDLSLRDVASVDDAVSRITSVLEEQGMEIVLIVDHAAAAQSVDLELRPTRVIFARPHRLVEHFLLKRSHTIGIDLPIKILVYENEQGVVRTLSNPAGYLIDRHNVTIRDPLLAWLQSKSKQFGDAPTGLITLASRLTFEETVESLMAAIPVPPFRIPLVLDFGAGGDVPRGPSHRNGRRSTLLVFGNPAAGTPLMQADQRIGIDLPQKFLIWENTAGGVNITWNDPFFIAGRYDIKNQEARLETIANALQNFARKGAGY